MNCSGPQQLDWCDPWWLKSVRRLVNLTSSCLSDADIAQKNTQTSEFVLFHLFVYYLFALVVQLKRDKKGRKNMMACSKGPETGITPMPLW